ncbi:MAG TPA: hypothetical protein VEU33_13525 [Archangium sp.]|nr:hypothetical protein [Archangium sp.]
MMGTLLHPVVALPQVLAYIDPGTGSFLFQMLMAGILSLGLMLTTLRERMKNFFKTRLGARNKAGTSPESTGSQSPPKA